MYIIVLIGTLSVPGPRRNPNVASLVHTYIGNNDNIQKGGIEEKEEEENKAGVDTMVVHRLDMDTSGVIVYARNKHTLSLLHDAFRAKSFSSKGGTSTSTGNRNQPSNSKNHKDDNSPPVTKAYEALLCGHIQTLEGEIDLPLVRDRKHPPFMKVWTGENKELDMNDIPPKLKKDVENSDTVQKHRGYVKMMSKAPKESLTHFRVIRKEYLTYQSHQNGMEDEELLPVTRVQLIPITGRTHQLRVHCAAIGHPIIGDNIYGIHGDGSPNGGFADDKMEQLFPHLASSSLQEKIYTLTQQMRDERKKMALDGGASYEVTANTGDGNVCGGIQSSFQGNLCLHAKRLCLQHPTSNAPMCFEVDSPF